MRLSALEIKKKEFVQKMRGFDPDEVQAFLDLASEEVELLTREKKEAEERLAGVQEKLDHYLLIEQTLEKTLVAAQQTAVKVEEQARKEADLILRGAELERAQKLNDVRMEFDRAQSDLFRARSEYQSMLSRMRSLMSGFTTFIQSLEQETEPASTNASEIPTIIEFYE
ncbi:MAG TPA: DivIVA domain-containing protein [Candidatus Kapabacteria bacterium]|jgi:cell division initiation protein|nr:DivIVA domain-containing protein [Candidatus Kapabacteria bacterium]